MNSQVDIAEKLFMNMAILIIPMKLAWLKVSKKHLDFEICLSDTREPLSYPHIQMPKWRIFHGRYDLSDDFFSSNEVF